MTQEVDGQFQSLHGPPHTWQLLEDWRDLQ